ncbi:MAG: peptidylprolyl isomerase [Clostridiales bacterium]|jgi:peptidyl-prolyl cis-trans isomerase B (cyclophilin B)|nr:peptidylprolyl isomerase [Clostridiales bacterium]
MRSKSTLTAILLCFAAVTFVMAIALGFKSCTATEQKYIDLSQVQLVQLDGVKVGDPIAIIKTNLGEIRAVLYPKEAPKTVENFIALAESGYYDGTYIYKVEPGICFSAGSKDADGLAEIDFEAEHQKAPVEISENLWPFKGAFCTLPYQGEQSFLEKLKGETNEYTSSKFVVLNSIKFDEETKNALLEANKSDKLANAFIEKGGIPNFSQIYPIFAQTYEGFDVIDKITAVEINLGDKKNKPKEDIIIESIEISTYTK